AGPRGSGGWSWPVISAARAASASTTIVRTRPWRTRRCCAGARRTDPRLRPGSGVDLRGRVLARPPCRGRQSRRGRSNTYGLGAKMRGDPTPAWYRRLSPRLRRVAAASDRVPTLPLVPSSVLAGAVEALPPALAAENVAAVALLAQRIADGVCQGLGVARVTVRVELRRPPTRGGELHGLYVPGNGRGRDAIVVWMLTHKRRQVVAYKTFLRTLLHELCHHLDYTLLQLADSLHTQGFYRRESSLFAALGAGRVDIS